MLLTNQRQQADLFLLYYSTINDCCNEFKSFSSILSFSLNIVKLGRLINYSTSCTRLCWNFLLSSDILLTEGVWRGNYINLIVNNIPDDLCINCKYISFTGSAASVACKARSFIHERCSVFLLQQCITMSVAWSNENTMCFCVASFYWPR